jgi:RNA polymerase sigma-70 factor (ECF subfamily)
MASPVPSSMTTGLASLIVAEIPRLRRYARALVRDGARADDLVQDCLERAWNRQHLWRDGGSLKSWLFTILHNLHANDARRLSREPATVAAENAPAGAAPARQDERLAVEDIATALHRLSEEHRAVIMLVGVEQMTYEEAAGVLGVPVGTVMSRLHRGRERLRQLLRDGGVIAERVS